MLSLLYVAGRRVKQTLDDDLSWVNMFDTFYLNKK